MSRVFQWIIIILILSALGGGYWYWKSARAGIAQQSVPNTGLIGYWNFDEGTGTTAGDASGNGFSGTLTNGPTWVDGRMVKGLSFDGTDDYVSIPDQDAFSPVVNDLTVSFWAKIPTNAPAVGGGSLCGNAGSNMLGKGNSISGWEYTIENDNNELLCFNLYQSGGSGYAVVYVNKTLNDGKWHHYSMSVDYGVLLTAYIDGVSVGSTVVFAGSMINTTLPLEIGRRGDGNNFTGQIDEVRVHNRALSAAEVADIYGLGAAREKTSDNTGLVGYWSFEDGRGTQATDFSPAGNNTGTLTNGPTWTSGRIGKALSFNGTTQYVRIGASNISSPCTMSAWINLSSRSSIAAGLISNADGSSGFRAEQYSSDAVGMTGGGDLVFSPSYVVPLNTWTHLVAVVNSSSSATLYVNGISSGTISGGALVCGQDSIGVNGGGFLHGSIDEVRIYNRALSATEIADLYSESSHTTINDSRNSILTNGLVGQWSFNGPDVSGTTAYDRSGQGNNGTLTNGPTAIPGKIGQALRFDGIDDYIPTAKSLASTFPFSISLWHKGTSLALGEMDSNRGFDLYTNGSCLTAEYTSGSFANRVYNNSGFCIPSSQAHDGNWHHIVYIIDATGGKLYLDGSLTDTEAWVGTPGATGSTNNFTIGRRPYYEGYTNGSIDEVRIYNRALSVSEINDLYLMGR